MSFNEKMEFTNKIDRVQKQFKNTTKQYIERESILELLEEIKNQLRNQEFGHKSRDMIMNEIATSMQTLEEERGEAEKQFADLRDERERLVDLVKNYDQKMRELMEVDSDLKDANLRLADAMDEIGQKSDLIEKLK